jgi:hypothetical protein
MSEEALPIVPEGAVLVRHSDPQFAEPTYVLRDEASGAPLCWRCRRPLADHDVPETKDRPVGRLDRETYGHQVVVCPGCQTDPD